MGFLGIPWGSLGFFGVLWGSLEFLGVSWGSLGFLEVPLESLGISYCWQRGLNGYSVLFSSSIVLLHTITVVILQTLVFIKVLKLP